MTGRLRTAFCVSGQGSLFRAAAVRCPAAVFFNASVHQQVGSTQLKVVSIHDHA